MVKKAHIIILTLLSLGILSLIGWYGSVVWQAVAYSKELSFQPKWASESGKKKISLEQSVDGVDVMVRDVLWEADQTIISLYVSNHGIDLSSADVQGLSHFGGVAPRSYTVTKSLMGGHHVESMLIFPADVSGDLVVGIQDDLSFTFRIEKNEK